MIDGQPAGAVRAYLAGRVFGRHGSSFAFADDGRSLCFSASAVAGDARGETAREFVNGRMFSIDRHCSLLGYEKTRRKKAAKNRRKKCLRLSRILPE
jgi:hypothetical protein